MSNPQPVDQPVDAPLDPETSARRRKALVALVLLLVGATMTTVGASLLFGVPVGVTVLGVLLLVGGVALGTS